MNITAAPHAGAFSFLDNIAMPAEIDSALKDGAALVLSISGGRAFRWEHCKRMTILLIKPRN